jgi:uncharacterized damage-inducible protein DinB
MSIGQSLIQEFEQEAATTRRVLERVPADKLSWKPHEKSMSMGQLALHVAGTPGNVTDLVSMDSVEIPQFTQPEATSSDEILSAHDAAVAKAKEYLAALSDESAMSTWKATAGGKTMMEVPRIGIIRTILLNHWYHHRGQLSVYLRLTDTLVPSIYGPSADENPFAA